MTDILMDSKYIVLNNNVTAELGINASIMLSSLAGRHDCYLKYEKIKNSDDWFYCIVDDIKKDTGLSRFQQAAAIKVLITAGIIESKTEKKPFNLRYFRFTDKCMKKLADICGKFFSADNSNNLNTQSNNLSCTGEETSHKSININNQNNNDDIIQQEKNFFEQIEIERLTTADKEFSEMVINIVKPLFKNQFGRINRRNMHISAIMKQFSKLTYEHMLAVREKLDKFKDKADNISAYLLTMIYNIADIPKKFLFKSQKKSVSHCDNTDKFDWDELAVNRIDENEALELKKVKSVDKPAEPEKTDDKPAEPEKKTNRDDEIKQILKSAESEISCKKTYDEAVAWLENICSDWKSYSDCRQVQYIKNLLSWYPDAPDYL